MYKVGGFAELLPEYKILEEQMLKIISDNYKKFGYTPIETPAMEQTKVLTAKAGGEAKNQIFGVYGLAQGAEDLKDYSLRYDFTVPFSRYVLDYRGELAFPFKRSAIGKVWRGERQQRGRSKEFYQADIDAIWEENEKKNYLFYDAEVINVASNTYKDIFKSFNLESNVKINVNNRKIIAGFVESLGLSDKLQEISIIIDKIDKIPEDKFKSLLSDIVNSEDAINVIYLFCKSEIDINSLETIASQLEISNEEFDQGVAELKEVLNYLKMLGLDEKVINVNLSIVRGLDYYTGTVFETFIDGDRKLGSVGSGGRYEGLTSYIDPKTNFSGVGFSIGVTRLEEYIFEKVDKTKLAKSTSEYLIVNFQDTLEDSLKLYNRFSKEGKKVEFFPESDKLQKQFKYADKKGIKYCVILGVSEKEKGIYILKDMKTGENMEIKL